MFKVPWQKIMDVEKAILKYEDKNDMMREREWGQRSRIKRALLVPRKHGET